MLSLKIFSDNFIIIFDIEHAGKVEIKKIKNWCEKGEIMESKHATITAHRAALLLLVV